MTAYKFLAAGRHSPYGRGVWTPRRPRYVNGPIVPCRRGIHYCRDLAQAVFWANDEMWTFEDLTPDETLDEGDKTVTRKGRILERVESWTPQAATRLAYAIADHAVRVTAAEALRAAGMMREADALAALPEIVNERATENAIQAAISASRATENAIQAAISASRATENAIQATENAIQAAISASWASAESASWASAESASYAAAKSASYAAENAIQAAISASRATESASQADESASWAARRASRAAWSARSAEHFGHLLADICGLPWYPPNGQRL